MSEQSASNIEALERALKQKEREIYSIQRIGKALSSTLQLDELLKLIMQEITILMDADRSTLYLVDHSRQEIWSKIALKAEVKEIRLGIGVGISGHVAASGEVINIPDAYNDDRFDPATDKRTGYRTRSILCMPIFEPHGQDKDRRILGVIQVLNKTDGVFSDEDEALLEALSSQVAISIANSRLYHRVEKKLQEIDLLYEFEQLLSAVYELPVMLAELLQKTVRHLNARSVVTIFPAAGQYIFAVAGERHDSQISHASALSLGLVDFLQRPTRERMLSTWEELSSFLSVLKNSKPEEESPVLYSHVDMEGEQQGILMALDVEVEHVQNFEDERMMIELVAQKIARARELHLLRDGLVKRERMSAIGQLMSTIVHDIRGPIGTIQGFVDLLGDDETSAEERQDYTGIIFDEIKSLTNMVTEILDFAKGKTNILTRKSSVKKLMKRFQPRIEEMCRKKDMELEIDVQTNKLILIDEEKLLRVFHNITKNGLEAMESDGKFIFRVTDAEDTVVFHFIDNGPGIPEEIQDRLFDSFVTSGKEKGTGLGLAIVKKIVDEHKGTIEIDSREGEGATFRIALPVHKG